MPLKLQSLAANFLHKETDDNSEHRKILFAFVYSYLNCIFVIIAYFLMREKHEESIEFKRSVGKPEHIVSPYFFICAADLMFEVVRGQ